MKPQRKLARELPGETGLCSIKLKVIDSKIVKKALASQTLDYQMLTFQDEEGSKVYGTLYNDSLAEFEDTLENEMEYEITNAKIKLIAGSSYQLKFNINTTVDRIPYQPNYISIASIPRTVSLSDRYDILGIVIYVDPNCKITRPNGQTRDLCEVIIVDQSSEQIMIITAWEQQAIEECHKIQSIATPFPVIGFTALKSTTRKGFSLAMTPKTSITLEAKGEEANSLRAWGEANLGILADKSHKVFKVRHQNSERSILTVEQLLQKTAKDTLQEEQHWLNVYLSKASIPELSFYHGYSNCGTGNYEHMGVKYNCRECFTDHVISSARMSIKFEVADDTGSYVLEALTANTEILLDVAVTDLYSMLPQEKEDYIRQIVRHLRDTSFYIQVAPAPSLSTKQELVWVLKEVSLT